MLQGSDTSQWGGGIPGDYHSKIEHGQNRKDLKRIDFTIDRIKAELEQDCGDHDPLQREGERQRKSKENFIRNLPC